uniref:Uncharacterized protein n=1 Tax=Rhizophora mucronata TaxID=61149 RepID=A0A2P2MSQ0_RHIMU
MVQSIRQHKDVVSCVAGKFQYSKLLNVLIRS